MLFLPPFTTSSSSSERSSFSIPVVANRHTIRMMRKNQNTCSTCSTDMSPAMQYQPNQPSPPKCSKNAYHDDRMYLYEDMCN